VAMATAGTSRPCSGGEHLISHALDALLGSNASPHGVQVALGTLMLAKPHGFDLPKLRSVLRSCGVPVTLEEAGIDLDIMKKAVEIAPSMRPDRYTVLNELAAAGMTPEALVHDLLP
jgi:glycerol-1-phosphate dehydrogenase [NAD(P)+]